MANNKNNRDDAEVQYVDIIALRKAKDITQDDLGKMLGITGKSISAMERGSIGIPSKHKEKLAKILGCKPEEIPPNINQTRQVRLPEGVGHLMRGMPVITLETDKERLLYGLLVKAIG
jgi:DNA-binding XRE family transcriptional regulator